LKPFSSGGGHGIRPWKPGDRIPTGCFVQQRIDGTPGSVVFVAAGGQATVLGISRQLIGDARFGASGFRYCGNALAPASDPQFDGGPALAEAAARLADVAAAQLALVGVNGLDFVACGTVLYPIEINPRWSASMELVERSSGMNVFNAHAAACAGGRLPAAVAAPATAVAKAIVFARTTVIIGSTDTWLEDPDVRDVPHRGDTIAAGHPVCTVFATGVSAADCEAQLVQRAARIYQDIE
jgi:predicted ATP-grasp superfamily ATP-dependent carboligase